VIVVFGLWCVCDALVVGSGAWLTLAYGEEMSRPATSSVAEMEWWAAWIVFGWIVPVVNLWFPYQIVQSIWRTSDPSRIAASLSPSAQ
jgi:hypothetical protein